MGAAIGEVLPLALGVAMSPMPIVAAILLLLSPNSRVTSLGYLAGWLAGIAIPVTVFTLLSAIVPRRYPDQAEPILASVKLVLGAILLVAGALWFRSRRNAAEEPEPPKWALAIDSLTVWRALALGFSFAAINPKNLALALAAGAAVGEATLPPAQDALAVILYTVIASASVGVPVVADLVAPRALLEPLRDLREWLLKNNSTMMAVVLVVLGVILIGAGMGTF